MSPDRQDCLLEHLQMNQQLPFRAKHLVSAWPFSGPFEELENQRELQRLQWLDVENPDSLLTVTKEESGTN